MRSSKRNRGPHEPEQVLYVPEPPTVGSRVHLTGTEADHARRSLRLRTGDPVHLVDGAGGRYPGRVEELQKRAVVVSVEAREELTVWPSRPVWMAAGILRSTRMDTLVEKASELGVSVFCPLTLKRSVARPAEEGAKHERWHRLAVESLKQSKRAHLMQVEPPRELEELLSRLPKGAEIWGADPAGEDPRTVGSGEQKGPLVLVVGPEGGLAPEERAFLREKGARWISLGKHRLRAETASMVLLATALATRGEMTPGG